MAERDDPEMDVGKGGEGEAAEVDAAGSFQSFIGRLADGACELYAAYPPYTYCLQGDGACDGGVAAELRAVPGCRVGSDDKCVVIFVPGIEARCAPRSALADSGYAEQMVAAQKRPHPLMQFYSFHRNVSSSNPASANTLSVTVMTSCSIVCGRL